MQFSAILHGADPKEFEEKEEQVSKGFLFGDPKDYEKMDEKTKKELTDKMKNKFMRWAKNG